MEEIIKKISIAIGMTAVLTDQYDGRGGHLNDEDNQAAHMGVEQLLREIRADLTARQKEAV